MLGRCLSLLSIFGLLLMSGTANQAQETPDLHVVVNMVQLNVAVTDKNGNYLNGLQLKDFAVTEDGIAQQIATFGEGNEPIQSRVELMEPGREQKSGPPVLETRPSSPDSPETLESLI